MFGTKKLANLVDRNVSTVRGSGNSVSIFATTVLAVVVVIFVICGVVFYGIQHAGQSQSQERQIKASAQGVAHNIAMQVVIYKKILQGVSQDPQLITLLEANDKSELSRKERELVRLFPEANFVQLLPVGWDDPQTGSAEKFSFATLAMLRTVSKERRTSPAEVHQFNSEQQHIAMAAPVLKGKSGAVVGVVLISLPLDLIERAVAGAGADAGYLQVEQVAGGASVLLAVNVPDGRNFSDTIDSIEIPGSIWSVAYGVGSTSVAWSDDIGFYGVLILGALLVVLLVLLLSYRFGSALKSDQRSIVLLVERLLQRRVAASENAKVSDLQGLMDHLVQMSHSLENPEVAGKRKTRVVNKETGLPLPSNGNKSAGSGPAKASSTSLPAAIFRGYDIRGIVSKDLTADVVYQLGRAIGSKAYDEGQQTVVVARDGRKSGLELASALCRGLMDSGRDVLDIGMVPTPLLYFATNFLGTSSGVMLTGSHNPPEYNGLKIVIAGKTLSGGEITSLRDRVSSGDLLQGKGSRTEQDLVADYLGRIAEDLHIARPLKVVIDCGNGVAGVIAPSLLKLLGCQVTELYCDVDGNFPHHHPDPSKPENLRALIEAVRSQQADIGIALDGDGDRIGVIDSQGNIIWPDRLLMLFAIDLLVRQPGADIIYDVKSSRHLAGQILSNGGRPLMWKSGHSLIKAKMQETGALLAGELSGHLFFKERWYGFDDGMYACARLLEIISADPRSSAELFAELPEGFSTPELTMMLPEGKNTELMEQLRASDGMPGAKLIQIDGIRAEFEHGWGLVRASNTMPAVIFRFEAEDAAGLKRLQELFRQRLLSIDPNLKLPF
ncbi:MAG: phosphomannomutase/phosphoglucomutase [Gammaproteobacteria bacterium]